MRRAPVLLVLAALLLAGCSVRGADPFAYTRKPLYTGHFDLAEMPAGGDGQTFRVDDGSIAFERVQVWINATAGGARVTVTDPSGRVQVDTTQAMDQRFSLELGAWQVRVEAQPGSAGSVELLVTRA